MTTIGNDDEQRKDLLEAYLILRSRGGRVIQYQEVRVNGFSFESKATYRCLTENESAVVEGLKVCTQSWKRGWQSPLAIVATIMATTFNLCGGLDLTNGVNASGPLADTPEHDKILREIDKKRSF